MSFKSNVIGWWKFDQSLEDQVATNDFVLYAGSLPSYASFQNYTTTDGLSTKYGLLFSEDNALYSSMTSLATDPTQYSINISFWYYSPNPVGQIEHVLTGEPVSKSAPVLAKATTVVQDGVESVVVGGGEWIITELGVSKSTNAIQLLVCKDLGNPAYAIISDPFLPGLHHVFISLDINSVAGTFYARIDIDGKFGNQHCLSSDIPSILNSGSPLWINKCNYGMSSHHASQTGAYISDLYILNSSKHDSEYTIKTIRFGAQSVLEQTYGDDSDCSYSFLGLGYAQPETISTTAIFSEGGHVFCARSNGELLEGHKPIWNNEFTFKNKDSLTLLTLNSNSGTIEWTSDGLHISGTSIRI